MRRPSQLCGALTAAVIGLSTLALPAVAHTGPGPLSCVGTAAVSPGLTVLVDKTFTWWISTRCDADGDPSTLEATLSATGDGVGRCGSTTAAGGVGEVEFDDGHRIELSNIAWPILPAVSGNHDNGVGDGNQDGTFSALVHANGGSDCLAEPGATSFDVTIEALLEEPIGTQGTPGAFSCAGTMQLDPGLTLHSDRPIAWEFVARCDTDGNAGTTEATLALAGSGVGRCGSWTAAGSGTLTLDAGDVVQLPQFAWQSGVLTGTHDNATADPSDDAAVTGSVVTSEGADCASATGATSSDVLIGAVLA